MFPLISNTKPGWLRNLLAEGVEPNPGPIFWPAIKAKLLQDGGTVSVIQQFEKLMFDFYKDSDPSQWNRITGKMIRTNIKLFNLPSSLEIFKCGLLETIDELIAQESSESLTNFMFSTCCCLSAFRTQSFTLRY